MEEKESDDRVYKILIVDDELEGLKALKATFERNKQFRCEVATATNGDGATRLLEDQVFDLVLSDYKMPGMDGIELLTYVREKSPDTLRILITAYSDLRVAVRAINRAEINNYMEKPWSNQELVSVAHAALQRKSERDALEKAEYDSVDDALVALRELQRDMSKPSPAGTAAESPRMTFEFSSPREFNRFSYEVRRLGSVGIEDVYVFENRYVTVVTVYPHTHINKA